MQVDKLRLSYATPNTNLQTQAKLCYYSEVFEDMFGLPRISGPDVASTTKNKPRIALQDDLEEFTMLLDALYRDM